MKVSLTLDHACNLRCSYCYTGDKFSRRMSMSVAKRSVAMAFDLPGPAKISFFGGEPLLRLDLLKEIVQHAETESQRRGERVYFSITTNATLLTEEVRDYLYAHRFYLGISIDGCRAAHDATRRTVNNKSSYDTIVENVRPILSPEPGTPRPPRGVKVLAVVDPMNVAHLGDSFEALLKMGAKNLSMNLNYEADWDQESLTTLSASLADLGERYMNAHRSGTAFTLNLMDGKIITGIKGGFSCADRCDFGIAEVAVAPSGRLYPCDRMVGEDTGDDVVIGNVWDGIDHDKRAQLTGQKNQEKEACNGCALLSRCMHWCGCVNQAMTGSVGGVSGLLCQFEQALVDEADRVASTLYQEQNPHFLRRFYAPRMAQDKPNVLTSSQPQR